MNGQNIVSGGSDLDGDAVFVVLVGRDCGE
jgi:hypothetical protein